MSPATEELAQWLISSKLGRGLQSLLQHFQMSDLSHGHNILQEKD